MGLLIGAKMALTLRKQFYRIRVHLKKTKISLFEKWITAAFSFFQLFNRQQLDQFGKMSPNEQQKNHFPSLRQIISTWRKKWSLVTKTSNYAKNLELFWKASNNEDILKGLLALQRLTRSRGWHQLHKLCLQLPSVNLLSLIYLLVLSELLRPTKAAKFF